MFAMCNRDRDPRLLGLYDSSSCARDRGRAVLAVMLGRRHRCTITPQVCVLQHCSNRRCAKPCKYKRMHLNIRNAVLKEGRADTVSNRVTDCSSSLRVLQHNRYHPVLYQIVVAVQRVPLVTVTDGVVDFANTSACALV